MLWLANIRVVVASKGTTSEDKLEVEFLTNVRNVDNPVATDCLGAVFDSSHISGVVVESSVGFLNNQGHFDLGDKHAFSTIAFNSNFPF